MEWTTILDASTAAAALQQGSQDRWGYPMLDLVDLLKHKPTIKVDCPDMSAVLPFMRHNSRQPPFNNPGVRRALLWAIDQQECMQAIAPDPSMYHVPVGMFTPNAPMADDTAMQPGWPDIPRLEQLRTVDLAGQQRLCREFQAVALDQVPVYPLGQYFQPTAYRTDITNVTSGTATFWNVRRSA